MASELENSKNNVIASVKSNIRILNYIVVLIIFTLFLVNTKYLSSILDYIPLSSVALLLFIVSLLFAGIIYLIKKISATAVNKLNEYSNSINELLVAKQQEIEFRIEAETRLRKAREELKTKVQERTAKLSETVEELKDQISKRKKTEKQLEYQAFYDQLTKLPNRSMFTKLLKSVVNKANEQKNYLFAVLFIDLDRFKIINDSLGHIIGDQLLVAAARRMEACIRPNDTLARFGGDEFAILLEQISRGKEATAIAERVQKELLAPFNLRGNEVYITASTGIAMSATGYRNEEDILRDADSAMYRAKALGRARYEIFDTVMHKNAMELMQMESDLRRAIKSREFIAYYQPIISLQDKKITGAEALIRWQHPGKGVVYPLDFIPLAEETGLIADIGTWILETACMQVRKWHDAGYRHMRVKVNFSARQFYHQDILKIIKGMIKEAGIAPGFLDIEITETIATDDQCIILLNELSEMGIQVSIDDFGTGYSSLGSLKRLPVNTIKIDKSFIKDINEEFSAEGIVRTIISIAHNFNMKVLAEGVETEEQLLFLEQQGCDEMQGYLFSQPVTAEKFMKLLERESRKDTCSFSKN